MMAHVPYIASHLPTTRVLNRHATPVPARTAAESCTLEERLLAHLDEWMTHHPIAATIVAVASVAAFLAVTAGAVVASSM